MSIKEKHIIFKYSHVDTIQNMTFISGKEDKKKKHFFNTRATRKKIHIFKL